MSPKKSKLNIDLVIPVYNEAGVVEQTYAKVCEVIDALPHEFTFYYVDDGSEDATAESLHALAKKDKRVEVLELSRNFGHQAALSAGLDATTGDFVISMDADGQHPPAMIEEMIALFEQGYDIVQAQRMDEGGTASTFKRITSSAFYKLINNISGTQIIPGAADFRGMSRQAVDALTGMPEYHRFLRGMISDIGYKSVILPYRETERLAGVSKYSLGKMIRLAMDAIFSFSLVPLYIGLSAGGVFFLLAILQVIYVYSKGDTANFVSGWGSLMFVLLVASGVILIVLGFIGVYIGYIFQQVKGRPVYLLKKGRE
ncbi:MAG: glycosyltransferase [Anaerolineales bacterium]|nr:glycosyltransferase [Anaerolineales bacterium]